jgi:hypothetical protein
VTTVATELATPLRRARVAVVLNASDYDHFAVSGEGPYQAACPPWTDPPVFLADHDILERLGPLLEDGDVDAVVFASSSLSSAAAQGAIKTAAFTRLWAENGPASDVGVLMMHQFLSPDSALPLDFLGSAAFRFVGEKPRRVQQGDIRFLREWLFTEEMPYRERVHRFLALHEGYGAEKFCLWTRFEPRYPPQWERLVWEKGREPLIAASNAGDRVVIASRVPLDLMASTELLGSLLASCLRGRGCLLVEAPRTSSSTAFTPALASAIERGRFVYRVCPDEAHDIDPAAAPYQFFDELIVAPEWHVADLAAFDEPALLRKLEQGGSLVATFAGPRDSSVTVRLSGQPQYAARANSLASWLVPRLEGFKEDLWAARGLAAAVVATREAFEDDRLIPQALREDFVRRHVGEPLAEKRARGSDVDDNVLATLGMYATLRALRIPGYERLREWAEARLDRQLPSVIAQALILVPDLATPERHQRVRDAAASHAADEDDIKLLRAYAAVLFAEAEPERVTAAADPSLGLGVQAELLRAVARHEIGLTDDIVGLAALVRQRIDRLALGQGGLEAVCLGNAALIELARRQGIGPSAAVRAAPRELDARTIENTELVRGREDALRDADSYRRVGRQATTVLVWTLILLTVAAVVAIFIWFHQGIDAKFGFASGVFGLMSTLIGYVVAKARAAGLPPWPTG